MRRIQSTVLWLTGVTLLSAHPFAAQYPFSASSADLTGEEKMFEAFRRAASLGFEDILLHLFGDDDLLERVDRLPESEELPVDFDADGKIDLVVWREGSTRVAATSAKGSEVPANPRQSRTNVCYLADLGSDGIPDRAVEYLDTDDDGRIDRQTIYEITPGELSAPGVGVFVYIDLDGDNRFLQTTDYSYHSARDMWGSDFNGNICLIAGYRDEETGDWHSAYENPFCFFDDDGDGFTDQAVRYAGEDLRLETIRWSFDADGDAPRGGSYDYDFSLTATGPVLAPGVMADSVILRGGKSMRFVSWSHARDLARWTLWRSVLLVWDEEDRNTDAHPDRESPERWEGVIAESFRGFPRVGGPTCGFINKRYELDRDGSGRMGVYFSGVDRRIHLLGAEEGELVVGIPTEPPVRGKLGMADADRNGYFDRWEWTSDGKNGSARSIGVEDERVFDVPLDTGPLRDFWPSELSAARDRSRQRVLDSAGSDDPVDTAQRLWESIARSYARSWLARAGESVELDRLLLDRILWDAGAGLFAGDADAPESGRTAPVVLAECTPPLVLSLDPTGGSPPWPIGAAAVLELRSGGRRIPGQVEDRDGDGDPDHVYFPDCLTGSAELVIDPPSRLPRREQVRIDPWFADGIAIESVNTGFTFFDGSLGCLTKRQERLVLRGDPGRLPEPGRWGSAVAFEGEEPGIGGLHLLHEGRWIAGRGCDRTADLRVLAGGPLRVVLRDRLTLGDREIERTWSLTGEGVILYEEILVAGDEPVILGLSLPALETGGHLGALDGVYSFGALTPGADPIGLAGAVLSPEVEAVQESIEGRPALRVTLIPAERLRLAWMAGGAAAGDSTEDGWIKRASQELSQHASRGPVYP